MKTLSIVLLGLFTTLTLSACNTGVGDVSGDGTEVEGFGVLAQRKGAKSVITVEDHYPEGGIGEAVRSALDNTGMDFYSLAVRKMPRSGKPAELLGYEEIDSNAIIDLVKKLNKNKSS